MIANVDDLREAARCECGGRHFVQTREVNAQGTQRPAADTRYEVSLWCPACNAMHQRKRAVPGLPPEWVRLEFNGARDDWEPVPL